MSISAPQGRVKLLLGIPAIWGPISGVQKRLTESPKARKSAKKTKGMRFADFASWREFARLFLQLLGPGAAPPDLRNFPRNGMVPFWPAR